MRTILIVGEKKLPAAVTDPVKLYEMIADPEIVFLRKPLFGFLQKRNFVLDELIIINDAPAALADQMMVVISADLMHQLITRLAVSEIEFEHQSHLNKQFQGPVNRGKADRRMLAMNTEIDFLRTRMIRNRHQVIQYHAARYRHFMTTTPKPILPAVYFLDHPCHASPLLIMIIIIEIYHGEEGSVNTAFGTLLMVTLMSAQPTRKHNHGPEIHSG